MRRDSQPLVSSPLRPRRRAERDRVPYDRCAAQGLIEATAGNVVDYGAIEQRSLQQRPVPGRQGCVPPLERHPPRAPPPERGCCDGTVRENVATLRWIDRDLNLTPGTS